MLHLPISCVSLAGNSLDFGGKYRIDICAALVCYKSDFFRHVHGCLISKTRMWHYPLYHIHPMTIQSCEFCRLYEMEELENILNN